MPPKRFRATLELAVRALGCCVRPKHTTTSRYVINAADKTPSSQLFARVFSGKGVCESTYDNGIVGYHFFLRNGNNANESKVLKKPQPKN
jgi:hypothetical protein